MQHMQRRQSKLAVITKNAASGLMEINSGKCRSEQLKDCIWITLAFYINMYVLFTGEIEALIKYFRCRWKLINCFFLIEYFRSCGFSVYTDYHSLFMKIYFNFGYTVFIIVSWSYLCLLH